MLVMTARVICRTYLRMKTKNGDELINRHKKYSVYTLKLWEPNEADRHIQKLEFSFRVVGGNL